MKTPDPRGFPRSSGLSNSHVLGPLSDARIAHYCRLGYYGEDRRLAQLEADAADAAKPKRASPWSKALDLLNSL